MVSDAENQFYSLEAAALQTVLSKVKGKVST